MKKFLFNFWGILLLSIIFNVSSVLADEIDVSYLESIIKNIEIPIIYSEEDSKSFLIENKTLYEKAYELFINDYMKSYNVIINVTDFVIGDKLENSYITIKVSSQDSSISIEDSLKAKFEEPSHGNGGITSEFNFLDFINIPKDKTLVRDYIISYYKNEIEYYEEIKNNFILIDDIHETGSTYLNRKYIFNAYYYEIKNNKYYLNFIEEREIKYSNKIVVSNKATTIDEIKNEIAINSGLDIADFDLKLVDGEDYTFTYDNIDYSVQIIKQTSEEDAKLSELKKIMANIEYNKLPMFCDDSNKITSSEIHDRINKLTAFYQIYIQNLINNSNVEVNITRVDFDEISGYVKNAVVKLKYKDTNITYIKEIAINSDKCDTTTKNIDLTTKLVFFLNMPTGNTEQSKYIQKFVQDEYLKSSSAKVIVENIRIIQDEQGFIKSIFDIYVYKKNSYGEYITEMSTITVTPTNVHIWGESSFDKEFTSEIGGGYNYIKKSPTVYYVVGNNWTIAIRVIFVNQELSEAKINDRLFLPINKNYTPIKLSYTVTPSNAIYEKLKWKVSDESLASINEDGEITCYKTGIITVYLYTYDDKLLDTKEFVIIDTRETKVIKKATYNDYYQPSYGIFYLFDNGILYGKSNSSNYLTALKKNIKNFEFGDIKYSNTTYKRGYFLEKNGYWYELSSNMKIISEMNNVKDIFRNYILTNDGILYRFDATSNFVSPKKSILKNVRSIKGVQSDYNTSYALLILTEDNKLYVIGDNIYGEKINNGESFTTAYLLFENVKDYGNNYILLLDSSLYYFNSTLNEPEIVDTDVSIFYETILSDDITYLKYDKSGITCITKITFDNKNVISKNNSLIKSGKYFIDENNNILYDELASGIFTTDKIVVKNAKQIIFNRKFIANIGDLYFISSDNKLNYLLNGKIYTVAYNIDEINDVINTTFNETWTLDLDSLDISNNWDTAQGLNNILTIDGNEKDITEGETLDITLIIIPKNASAKNLKWSVDNNELGTISNDGKFIAKKAGIAYITIETLDGKINCIIKVHIHPKISGIASEGPTKIPTNEKDENYEIKIKILPEDAIKTTLMFESTNSDVVEIISFNKDNSGTYDYILKIKAGVITGNVYIIVKNENGKEIDRISIAVFDRLKDIGPNDIRINLGENNTYQLDIEPKSFDKSMITYEISDESIGKIDANGLITALKNGNIQLIIKVNVGSVYSFYKVINVNVITYNSPDFDNVKGEYNAEKLTIEKIDVKTTAKDLKNSIINNNSIIIVDEFNNIIDDDSTLKSGYKLIYKDIDGLPVEVVLIVNRDLYLEGIVNSLTKDIIPSAWFYNWDEYNQEEIMNGYRLYLADLINNIDANISFEIKKLGHIYTKRVTNILINFTNEKTKISYETWINVHTSSADSKADNDLIRKKTILDFIKLPKNPEELSDYIINYIKFDKKENEIFKFENIIESTDENNNKQYSIKLYIFSNETNDVHFKAIQTIILQMDENFYINYHARNLEQIKSDLSNRLNISKEDFTISHLNDNYYELTYDNNRFNLMLINENNNITSIKFTINDGKYERTASIGDELQLIKVFNPVDAIYEEFIWSSSNPEVAIIDETGLLKVVSYGKTTITLTNPKTQKSYSKEIIFHERVIDSIVFESKNHIIFEKGNSNKLKIDYVIYPLYATGEKILWTSSDSAIASVDENGVVTAYKKGKVTITAKHENSGVSSSIEIEILDIKDTKILYYDNHVILYDDGSLYIKGEKIDNTYTSTYRYLDNDVKKVYNTGNKIYFLKNNNILYRYNLYDNKKEKIKILENVLDFTNRYVVTTDSKLYELSDDMLGDLILENVKCVFSENTSMNNYWMVALTNDNKLYVLNKNIYGEKINNDNYFTIPYLLFENVKEFDIENQYVLLNNGDLYVFSSSILAPQKVDIDVTKIIGTEGTIDIYDTKYIIYLKGKSRKVIAISIENKMLKIEQVNYYIWDYLLKENGDLYINEKLIGKNVTKVIKSSFDTDIYFLTIDGKLYYAKGYSTYLFMESVDEILEKTNLIRTKDGDYWYFDFDSYSERNYPEKIVKNTTEKIYPNQIMLYAGYKKDITIGDTINLLAVIFPYNTSNKNLIWRVENEEFGTVTSNGIFFAKKVGIVKVFVMTEDGTVENFFEITIHSKISGTSHIGPTLVPSQNGSNQKNDLFIDIEPKDALKKDLLFESSNENIIKINSFYKNGNYYNENGELIKTYDYVVRYYAGSIAGEAYIITKTEDGEVIDRILIKVYKGINSEIPNYINIDLNEKNTYQLDINKDYDKNMTKFEITGGSNAKIDENGLITVSKSGEFTITIKNIVGGVYEIFKNIYVSVTSYVKPIFDKVKGIFNEAKKLIEKIDIGTTVKNLLDSIKNNDKVKIVDRNNNEVNGNQILKTGYRLYYLDSNSEYRSYTLSISGDVNEDGKISAMDYVKIKNHIMKTNLIVNNENLSAADFNNDGKISAMDYVKIKNHIMNGGK